MFREVWPRSKQLEIFRFLPRISYFHHNGHSGSYPTGLPCQNGNFTVVGHIFLKFFRRSRATFWGLAGHFWPAGHRLGTTELYIWLNSIINICILYITDQCILLHSLCMPHHHSTVVRTSRHPGKDKVCNPRESQPTDIHRSRRCTRHSWDPSCCDHICNVLPQKLFSRRFKTFSASVDWTKNIQYIFEHLLVE